jgi:hypothetical protein
MQTISLLSPLPPITAPVTIDGTSQPGYVGSPLIMLDGSSAGAADALTITAGSTTVQGLDIENFQGDGIVLMTNGGDVIAGNSIGMSGDIAGDGVHIVGVADNQVGGTAPGQGNAIVSNGGNGVDIDGETATGNIIEGNVIGMGSAVNLVANSGFEGGVRSWNLFGDTDSFVSNFHPHTGQSAFAFASVNGFTFLSQYLRTTPGGTYHLTYWVVDDGRDDNSFEVSWDGTSLFNDQIVTTTYTQYTFDVQATGASSVLQFAGIDPPGIFYLDDVSVTENSNMAGGIRVHSGASSNQIGGSENGARNVIDGNGSYGVSIDSGAFGNTISGNFIGTDQSGTIEDGNGGPGVLVASGAHDNHVQQNVISGNGNGITITDSETTGNIAQGNMVGLDASGTALLPNVGTGIAVLFGASGNLIGADGSGAAADAAARNIISGNGAGGIQISGPGTNDNVVAGNFLGTDITGMVGLGNGGAGVEISGGAQYNRIGTDGQEADNAGEQNLISGNASFGVLLENASFDLVAGNGIGIDRSGSPGVANAGSGVRIDGSGSHSNQIGLPGAGLGNILSSQSDGVEILVAAGNSVQGNTIVGLEASSSSNLLTNGDFETGDLTGWTVTEGANFTVDQRFPHTGQFSADLSGRLSYLSQVIPTTPGQPYDITCWLYSNGDIPNEFQVWWSGTILWNRLDLFYFGHYAEFTFGGTATGTSSVLQFGARNDSGSFFLDDVQVVPHVPRGYGVHLTYASLNEIGAAQPEAANVIEGYSLGGVSILVGDGNSIAGNSISFNNGNGITIANGTGNSVRGNAIYANSGLGIDLGDNGVTPNHPDNPDVGPNHLQNFPIISQANSAGDVLTISGSFNSASNATFTLDFYASAVGDPSGFGEGQIYLGAATVTTDANGNANFQVSVPAATDGDAITATATSAGGDTSEFSSWVTAEAMTVDTNTTVSSSANPSVFGQTVTFTASVAPVSGSGMPTGMVTFLDDGAEIGAAALSGGVATFTISSLTIGNHAIIASYAGDADFVASTSAPIAQIVNPNHPPVLDPIPELGLSLGRTLTYTAHATDPDSPPQTLTFSLDPGAPSGAHISPATGVFTVSNLKFGTYTITIRVTDNGNPPLSAAQTFHVVVAPQVKSITLNDGSIKKPSIVGYLTVVFNSEVTIAPDAFQMVRLGSGGGSVGLTVATTYVLDGKTYVILTFGGPFVLPGGTLTSGKYALTTQGSLVHGVGTGLALDGDNNGLPGGDNVFRFSVP